jgi:hypothetical protein
VLLATMVCSRWCRLAATRCETFGTGLRCRSRRSATSAQVHLTARPQQYLGWLGDFAGEISTFRTQQPVTEMVGKAA